MSTQPARTSYLAYATAILGTFFIIAALVWVMQRHTQPAPLGAERAAERKKALTQIHQEESVTLNNYDWVDKDKGIVRLPVARAMEIVIQEYKNPAASRSNVLARVEKANAKAANKYE